MKLSFFNKNNKDSPNFINEIKLEDAPLLAELHGKCFALAWDNSTFQNFLRDKQFLGLAARKIGSYKKLLGFILVRMVMDEAELITIAVDPQYRQNAIAYNLLSQMMRYLEQHKIAKFFLEVAESNMPARNLYKKLNFARLGKRKSYYPKTASCQQQANNNSLNKAYEDALILCYSFPRQD